MNILVALITPNERACKTFIKNQESLLRPSDVHEALTAPIQFCATYIDANLSEIDAQTALLKASADYDAVAVILDAAAAPKLNEITNGLLVYNISLAKFIENIQNTLLPITSRLIRNFSFLLAKFENSEQFYAAAVPIRNFDADEVRTLRAIFANITFAGNFNNDVSRNITKLMGRRNPKPHSRFPDQYLIDDSGKHFKFGHELHANIDTAPPHKTSCELNGRFRFGKRLPEKRHFNVSNAKGSISGIFPDCHDTPKQVPDRTHLNMFSSDFQT